MRQAEAERLGAELRRPLDRESGRAETRFQNGHDLARCAAVSAPTPCWAAGRPSLQQGLLGPIWLSSCDDYIPKGYRQAALAWDDGAIQAILLAFGDPMRPFIARLTPQDQ